MTIELANAIVDYDNSGSIEIHEVYSGRAMNGETAAAVVGNIASIMKALLLIEPDEIENVERTRFRIDSMGLSSIVY